MWRAMMGAPKTQKLNLTEQDKAYKAWFNQR